MAKRKTGEIRNLVVVSDIHAGCRLALCPPEGAKLDDGGTYKPSAFQSKVWAMWEEFWGSWVPWATAGEPYAVCINGDLVEGVHHRSTTQISHNLEDQAEIAYRIASPLVEKCEGRFYMIRGTSAHVGESGVDEERLAKRLGAIPNAEGQYSRYELWKQVGTSLVHCLHHIGTTGSSAYEGTAVHKELVESFVEAARWGNQPPDYVVRSHRHRHYETKITTARGVAAGIVTPGWQGRTPFAMKIPGARLSPPQFGGIVIRQGDDVHYVKEKVWAIGRPDPE